LHSLFSIQVIMEKIVITGIGCVSAIGASYGELGAKLLEGASGVRALSLFDGEGLGCRQAAEVPELDFKSLLPGIDVKAADRTTLFSLLATKLALDHAGLNLEEIDRSRVAVVIGTAQSSFAACAKFYQEFFEGGAWQVSPITFANTPINVPTARVAMYFGLQGPNTTISNGQTSSLKALAYACDLIRLGQADIVLAGGAESLSKEKHLAYQTTRALSGQKRSPQERCAPFDANRNGLVLGEGAAMFVLQSLERAKTTAAPVRMEISGFGSGWHRQSDPCGRALVIAMERALEDARLSPQDIDLVLANANGSIAGDGLEAKALRSFFGKDCPDLSVSSIKAATGELRGAAGAMQTAAAAIAIEADQAPPTLNLKRPDRALPGCRISAHSLSSKVDTVLINAVEQLADSSSLVVRRPRSVEP
jgi:3-oxoacyl-[acyl-carrier-protein] synthase II